MLIEPNTAIESVLAIYENWRKLVLPLKKIIQSIRHGDLLIGVFGPGGTGKTTLGVLLSKGFSINRDVSKYSESIESEEYNYQGEILGKIIIPPGQEKRRDATWSLLHNALANKRNVVIINVVSYGYHSFGIDYDSYVRESGYDISSINDFMLLYLEKQRKVEMDVIRRVSTRISELQGRVQMITLITKQDLWWQDANVVMDYYQKGAYENYINEITRVKGSQNFEHEYIPVSLAISNLISVDGKLLAATAAGYDQTIQISNLTKAVMAIQVFAVH